MSSSAGNRAQFKVGDAIRCIDPLTEFDNEIAEIIQIQTDFSRVFGELYTVKNDLGTRELWYTEMRPLTKLERVLK